METQILPFPILSETSLCYVDRVSYQANVSRIPDGDIIVEHNLSDDNLVSSLVDDEQAKFACIVSIPSTMFRKVYRLDIKGEKMQKIPFDRDEFSGKPKLRPIVVCAGNIPPIQFNDRHGLDPIFYAGEHIEFPDGAIIADAGWHDFRGHGDILRIRKDDNLEDGTFRVSISETDSFYFVVSAAPDLFKFLQNWNKISMSIMTHAFSIGLSQLKSKTQILDNWKNYSSLQILHRDIEARGLASWDDEEFSPEIVATTIHPYTHLSEEDDDYDS